MKAIFRFCCVIYTAVVGLLTPLIIFLKSASFNAHYYPFWLVVFLGFLILSFLNFIFVLGSKKNSPALRFFTFGCAVLAMSSMVVQLYFIQDLIAYSEAVVSPEDAVFFSAIILILLITGIVLAGLIQRVVQFLTPIK